MKLCVGVYSKIRLGTVQIYLLPKIARVLGRFFPDSFFDLGWQPSGKMGRFVLVVRLGRANFVMGKYALAQPPGTGN